MAVTGDMKAMKLYLEISQAAHAVERHYREEILGAAIAYKDYWLPIFDECESQGRAVPSQLPHPRDIEIDGDGGITFVGPVDRETDELVRRCVVERDSLIEALRLLRRPDRARKIGAPVAQSVPETE